MCLHSEHKSEVWYDCDRPGHDEGCFMTKCPDCGEKLYRDCLTEEPDVVHAEPAKGTYEYAIKTLEITADFFHSMDIDPDNDFRFIQWITALELIERIQGLDEGWLVSQHDKQYGSDCDHKFMVKVWNI